MPRSFSNAIDHVNSQAVEARVQYSGSADDLDTVVCFLDFQEMIEAPRKQQKPVIDLLVSGHVVAQSESVKPFRCTEEDEDRKMPCPGLPLRYLSTL